jgi:hypothetical protein
VAEAHWHEHKLHGNVAEAHWHEDKLHGSLPSSPGQLPRAKGGPRTGTMAPAVLLRAPPRLSYSRRALPRS